MGKGRGQGKKRLTVVANHKDPRSGREDILLKCIDSLHQFVLTNVPKNHLRSSKTPFFLVNGLVHYFKISTFYSNRAISPEETSIKEEPSTLDCQTVTNLQKLKKPSFLYWVSSNVPKTHQRSSKFSFSLADRSVHNFETSFFSSSLKCGFSYIPSNHFGSSKPPFFLINGSCHAFKTSAFYSSRSVSTEKIEEISTVDCKPVNRIPRRLREAQDALLEYLHGTRTLPFADAEHISKHSPNFLEKLLKKVENEEETGKSLTRFFRYHPINEFEPFLESLGLKPSELSPLLPQHLMFLSDDDMLLENYHILCNYGITRSKIGKIYKEATEIFKYDYGVLSSNLIAYEKLGLSKSIVIKFIVFSPCLLVGDVNMIFAQVLEELKSLGIDNDWILGCLGGKNSYNWSQILETLLFFGKMNYSKEELGRLIKKHPGLLFDDSGKEVCSLLGLLLKLGSKINEISSLFLQIPGGQIGIFLKNFRQSLLFLLAIDMEASDIVTILCEHPLILGSCFLKKPSSVLAELNIGKKRLCGIIKENPDQLKCLALGSKIGPLPNLGEDQISLMQKTEFLLNLGFIDGSNEMKKALKVFRGKGGELQERFDCFVKAGLDPKVVSKMIKGAPHVLNQSKDVIEEKIDFLVNELHYPISSIVPFPSYISYTIERVKLRFSMYHWLKDEGKVSPKLALSTILACSDKAFVKQYVQPHNGGDEIWEKLKKDYLQAK